MQEFADRRDRPGNGHRGSADRRCLGGPATIRELTCSLVWAGTNDLSLDCTGDQIVAALTDVAQRAHAAGAQVLISTVSPRTSYTAAQNLYRAQVNAWVRSGGNCSGFYDHALDFDAVLRDPAQVNRIRPDLDSSDGVHPNPTGYGLVAGSVTLADLGA